MSKPKDAQVWMLLPAGAGRDVLRAGVMALRCVPTNLRAWDTLLQRVPVDVICQHHAVSRHAGQLVLQRLMPAIRMREVNWA